MGTGGGAGWLLSSLVGPTVPGLLHLTWVPTPSSVCHLCHTWFPLMGQVCTLSPVGPPLLPEQSPKFFITAQACPPKYQASDLGPLLGAQLSRGCPSAPPARSAPHPLRSRGGARTRPASRDLPAPPARGPWLGPYTPIAAWLQILPEGLHLGQVHLVEGDGHLPDGVIAAEAVVVQDLEVEDPLHHLLVGETWGTDGGGEERDEGPRGAQAGRASWAGRLREAGLAPRPPAAVLPRPHPMSGLPEALARPVIVSSVSLDSSLRWTVSCPSPR